MYFQKYKSRRKSNCVFEEISNTFFKIGFFSGTKLQDMCGQIYLKYVHCTYCELGLLRGLEFMWVCASIFSSKQFLKACSSDVPVIFMEQVLTKAVKYSKES